VGGYRHAHRQEHRRRVRPDVQAIVDAANEETAELRNEVIGTQRADILRDPTRLNESAMGNLVADAMRDKYPGVDAALTNSGGLRAELLFSPPSAGEQPGEITWGEVFAVLPFGNRMVILTLTGAQLTEALLNGFSPVCNPNIATGRFPQLSGLKLEFHCGGTTPVVDGIARAPAGPGGPLTPVGPGDTVRIVTNDVMFTGGDGYTSAGGRHRRAPAWRRPARDHYRVHSRELAGGHGRGGAHRQRLDR
jgi:2',3'-cyclic-nucleotide 2'-phosphodiesterase (5'-nucleotidase family)